MSEEPKIIVDEDWKDQVQKEKEQLREQEEAKSDEGQTSQGGQGEIPPASMSFLISMLSSQVMMALGFLPDPSGQQPPVDLGMAKHFIDLLGVLEEKTEGNLNDEEKQMLSESLHQFRMAFMQMTSQAAEPAAGAANENASDGPTIELP
jgi:hypothetical protein